MKKRLLFLFLTLLGTTEISMVFGETAPRIMHTEFQFGKQVKEKKSKRKKAKQVIFFQKIKNVFSLKNENRGTLAILLLGLGAAVAMFAGISLSTIGLIFLGLTLGFMAGIGGIILMKNGNSHWLVTVGTVLGFAVSFVPIVLLFNYLSNLEFS